MDDISDFFDSFNFIFSLPDKGGTFISLCFCRSLNTYTYLNTKAPLPHKSLSLLSDHAISIYLIQLII